MVEGFAEVSRSDGADSVDLRELGVSRLYDRGNAAEVSEQSLCRHGRDVRNGREHGFGSQRLRPLRVQGPVTFAMTSPSAAGDAVEPEGRVGLRLTSYDRDAVLADGEQCAPDRRRRKRTGVERRPFDKQIWRPSCGAKPAELSPEAARYECEVKVASGLALHEHPVGPEVADGKTVPPRLRADSSELLGDGLWLVHIDIDVDHLTSHAEIVPTQTSRICTYRRKVGAE